MFKQAATALLGVAALAASAVAGSAVTGSAAVTQPGLDRGLFSIRITSAGNPACTLNGASGPDTLHFTSAGNTTRTCLLTGFPQGSRWQVTPSGRSIPIGEGEEVIVFLTGLGKQLAVNYQPSSLPTDDTSYQFLIIPPNFP